MKFAKYWAKGAARDPASGRKSEIECWGWSDESLEHAAEVGRLRAERLAARLDFKNRPAAYTYGDHPIRESITTEWKSPAGHVVAVLTVNAYGCDILNTSRVMFVDVDLPDPRSRARDEEAALTRLDGAAGQGGGFSARVYRTAGGLRYLLDGVDHPPQSAEAAALLRSLGADPLYIKLCQVQDCYRARLTPKPWRCDFHAPGFRWPFHNETAAKVMAKWREKYLKRSQDYAVCEFMGVRGRPGSGRGEVQLVAAYHDRVTRAESGLPLA